MYIASMAAGAFGEEQDAPVCWCNRTLRELGPDGEPADLLPCSDASRSCHQTRPGAATLA